MTEDDADFFSSIFAPVFSYIYCSKLISESRLSFPFVGNVLTYVSPEYRLGLIGFICFSFKLDLNFKCSSLSYSEENFYMSGIHPYEF